MPGRVQTVLELPVRPGDEQAVVALFRELVIFELAARNEGFLGARLLVPEEAGRPLLVIADWRDGAAIDRWVSDPARERTSRSLEAHLTAEPVRWGYSIAVEWPPVSSGKETNAAVDRTGAVQARRGLHLPRG